jgi:uncharacterized protein (TIGR02145 family)
MQCFLFQIFKYSKFMVVAILLCIGFVFHSCGSAPGDTPTPVGYTLKVKMPAEYKNGIPAHGLLPSIKVEISDANGKMAENIKVTYQVKTGGGNVDRPSDTLSTATTISWQLGYQFGQQTMEISAYKAGTSTEHVSGSPFTVSVNTATVEDVDGNLYNLVKNGDQIWMGANMSTTKYRDGTPLLSDLDSAGWIAATEGAYVHANNDAGNDKTYGLMYNQAAVESVKGICPESYHVATFAEWGALIDLAGGENEAGNTLRSKDNWVSADPISTDSLLIAIQPAGHYGGGSFATNFGYQVILWSANPDREPLDFDLPFFTDGGYMFYVIAGKVGDGGFGIGCRCVQD